ncbi:hypothetical protein EV1_027891 [Malus domestica]
MACAGAAADKLFRCVYEGCISGSDIGVERHPYHHNCGCVLHNKSRNKQCTHGGPKSKKVSYPLRRAWNEGNLSLVAFAGSSVHFSSSSSPAQHNHAVGRAHHRRHSHQQLDTLCEEDEEEDIVFFNV